MSTLEAVSLDGSSTRLAGFASTTVVIVVTAASSTGDMPAFTPSISVAGSLSPALAADESPIGSWIKSVDSPVFKPLTMRTGKAASIGGTEASWVGRCDK